MNPSTTLLSPTGMLDEEYPDKVQAVAPDAAALSRFLDGDTVSSHPTRTRPFFSLLEARRVPCLAIHEARFNYTAAILTPAPLPRIR